MGLFVILVFIMDILCQNMPIYDKNVTFDPLGWQCKMLSLGVLVIFFEEVLTHFTFKMAYTGLFMILVFIMDIIFQNMPIYDQNVNLTPCCAYIMIYPLGSC